MTRDQNGFRGFPYLEEPLRQVKLVLTARVWNSADTNNSMFNIIIVLPGFSSLVSSVCCTSSFAFKVVNLGPVATPTAERERERERERGGGGGISLFSRVVDKQWHAFYV